MTAKFESQRKSVLHVADTVVLIVDLQIFLVDPGPRILNPDLQILILEANKLWIHPDPDSAWTFVANKKIHTSSKSLKNFKIYKK